MIVLAFATNTEQAVRRAAEEHGIDDDKFLKFWNDRFGHYAPGYVREWAERIKTKEAHEVADRETRAALRRAGFHQGR